GRTLCDRVIRACNHHLGEGSPDFDHVSQLVKLVELSLHGYDICAAVIAQSSPLYMEKIIFHIEDYCVLVRNCFSVLWSGLSVGKGKKNLNPRDKLHCQMQALSFLLLLDTESAVPSSSKVPIYTEDAITTFKCSCETMTKEDASFLIEEMHTLFNRFLTGGRSSEGDGSKQCADASSFYSLSAVALIVVKVLCTTSHYSLASAFLDEIESKVSDCECTALGLGKWGIKIHSTVKAGGESGQAFTECARALRSVSADLGDREAHAVLEGCSLVVWAVESGHNKGFSGPVLLALFSFLEEHQQALCVSIYKGFAFAYESMLASQDILDRVLLYCKATAGLMMTELRKLSNENLLVKAITVSNLACGLYNRRLYDQAFALVETLCRDLCKNCPVSLSIDKQLSRLFMLAVQTSRRSGHFEQALDWVILWLKALGDKITTHMAEPVSLWVKTKTDAAHQEDIRLTLRDGFGSDVPDEKVMLCLLEEELRAYKEVAADMAQERYNTLCDLLDICHEESSHTHLRAIYLCEMAQVVCFQDFSEQTDTAVDFTHEALRLLEVETETPENADKLKDDKAHALLWLYICTLEKNLQECVASPIGGNDFDYEDKQKTQASILVYERLHFNLAAENQPLERALDGWSALFQRRALPSVRNPKQTCSSIALTAALFRLMGKPLKALEAYQLVIGLSRQLADAQGCASALCQSARVLLAQLEQAEKALASDTNADSRPALSMLAVLLKAQYYYSTGQVDCGVRYLCEVLKEVNDQRQSKSWYLLRAQTFQTCSSYLSLDTTQLPQTQRNCITQHINTPDAALNESLKLLCSLIYTLVGGGLYGADSSSSSDVRFIDQDNLVCKWQLLSEVLNSSMKLVAVRSSCGAINAARHQCLEALKLAIKLQALSCAELLVMKAELELMQGEREESKTDLDKVRNLLELCTFSDQVKRTDVKIKPRKGRPVQKPQSPLPTMEDDLQDILSTRWIAKEPVVKDQSSSPPLKAQPCRWLSCLAHEPDCLCPCCSEPCLGRATARWAATQANLVLQLDPNEANVSFKLQRATLSRCKNLTSKLRAKLTELFPAKGNSRSSLMHDVVGRVYLCMALSGLEPRLNKACGVWKILEAGLAFVDSTPSPVLTPVRAGLMATKAIASLMLLAAKKGCTPEELFSDAWTWNLPKVEFSDESDSEASTQAESKEKADVLKKRTTARRAGQNAKNAPDPPAEKVQPKRQVKGKRSTAVHRSTSSEDETLVSTRRGRTRRQLSQADTDSMEEPDKMRSIEEETNEVLDISIEQLRTSDTEADDNADSNLSLEDVQSLLRSAWLSLQHFPSPTIYPNLCTLLALTMGQQDPNTTAMLHAQSLGVTVRHRTIRHLARCLKQKKVSSELTDRMDALSLNELSGSVSNTSTEQRLSQMENIFSFPTVDSLKFPQNHCQDFIQQIQHIPPVTVCLMSVLGVKPKEMGNSIILSRLEKGSAPVTVHINTSKQRPISWMVEEIDSILVEQQVVSNESVKAIWWGSRKTLDCRVEQLLKEMEGLLGWWRSLLLPLSLDSELSKQSHQLCKALSARGVTVSEEMLKAVLSASPVLSEEDLKIFAHGVSPQWNTECDQLLHCAVSQLSKRDEPKGHMVLILDKYLQKLPWESTSFLKSRSVSRMPSLHSLLGLCLQKESILRLGVDAKKVFYVLDPDANLEYTQDQFREWFTELDWEGVYGVAPDLGQLEEAVATKDLYYLGHGAGSRFLDSHAALQRQMRAACLLFGCSSAALAVRGDQEGQGIILDYLIAGSPFILGNLWNVTDRDIDRFTKALLEPWFSAESGASLLDHIGPARQAPQLKHLIGAAPVVYGLPVHLQ
uniref:separase n=1 Tax=Amphiprion percula TaxID=161767 RepID=A0A3P8TET8_AMPPE